MEDLQPYRHARSLVNTYVRSRSGLVRAADAALGYEPRGRGYLFMLFVRPATRDDAADIARIDVETWRTSYAGILPDKVLLGLTTGRLAREWQSQLSHRPDDVRGAERPRAGVIAFGRCAPIPNPAEGHAG